MFNKQSNIKLISENESNVIFQNAVPRSLVELFTEFIKEEKREEFFNILPKYLGESITGSYLCLIENELSQATKKINDAHPEDGEVQKAEMEGQEVVIFDE